MRRINVGIIGFGWAGGQHARALQQLSDRAQLVGVAESNAAALQRAAQIDRGLFLTTNYHELLALPQLDAVSICLPHNLHASVAIEAAQAGRHILVEKPLASTLSDADAMISAANSANVVLMVAENVRFNAAYLAVASRLQEGILGPLFLIRIAREHNRRAYLRERPWFLLDGDAGIMMSGGVHDLELLRMLGGEVEHIYGVQGPKGFPEMQADDNSVAVASLHSGAVGIIVETFGLRTPQSGVFGSVHGLLGSLWFQETQLRLYRRDVDNEQNAVETVVIQPQDTFIAELAHFLDCLITPKLEPVTSGRQVRATLAAVQAAYESMRTGRRVYLSENGLQ
jgi:UDP-N-acetyl-2-amino-2-deoxyglucuronate dehydrogenase